MQTDSSHLKTSNNILLLKITLELQYFIPFEISLNHISNQREISGIIVMKLLNFCENNMTQ